jgi:hypothetical protein
MDEQRDEKNRRKKQKRSQQRRKEKCGKKLLHFSCLGNSNQKFTSTLLPEFKM